MRATLDEINQEIQRLEAERKRLETLRAAKLELLKKQFGSLPSKFSAEHPVVYAALIKSKGISGSAARDAKEGAGKIMDYVEWVNEHPGKGIISYIAYKKEAKKNILKV